jgi:hypothetical protein
MMHVYICTAQAYFVFIQLYHFVLLYTQSMANIGFIHTYVRLLFIAVALIHMIQGNTDEQDEMTMHNVERRQSCPDSSMCTSQWGFCGHGDAYCGAGCLGGPCSGGGGGGGGGGDGSIITEQTFACSFNTIDAGTRLNRLNGLRNSGWKPSNKDEAAVFLAHVFHETDGLKTIREYCAPGQ